PYTTLFRSSAVFYNYHCTILKVADTLVFRFAGFRHEKIEFIPLDDDHLDRVRELIDIEHFDLMELADLVEIVICGDNSTILLFGQFYQLVIHIKFFVVSRHNINAFAQFLQRIEHIQTSFALVPFDRVRRIRDELQFIEHKLRDDELSFNESSFQYIHYSTIYDCAGIKKFLLPLYFPGIFRNAAFWKQVQNFTEFLETDLEPEITQDYRKHERNDISENRNVHSVDQ